MMLQGGMIAPGPSYFLEGLLTAVPRQELMTIRVHQMLDYNYGHSGKPVAAILPSPSQHAAFLDCIQTRTTGCYAWQLES